MNSMRASPFARIFIIDAGSKQQRSNANRMYCRKKNFPNRERVSSE